MKHTLDPLTGKAPLPAKDQLPNYCHFPRVTSPADMGHTWSFPSSKDWCWHLGKNTKGGKREREWEWVEGRESETEREQGREGEEEGEWENRPRTQSLWKSTPYSQNLSVTSFSHPHYILCHTRHKRTYRALPPKQRHLNVHSSFSHNCSKLETIQMSISRKRHRQMVVQSQEGILLSTNKEQTVDIHNHMHESRRHCPKQKSTKVHLVCFHLSSKTGKTNF